MKVWFRPAHIEGEGWFRKRRDCLRMGYQPSVDGWCLLTQTAANKGEQGKRLMTNSAASGPQPAFLEVGRDDTARSIAVRARPGGAPELLSLCGMPSDMQ